MRPLAFLFLAILIPFQTFAQDRATTQFQEYSSGVGSFIQGIPVKKQPMQGDMFVYKDFTTAAIVTKADEVVEQVPLRYNALDQQVEVKTGNNIQQLDGHKIKYFYLQESPNEKFVHVSELPTTLPYDQGFLKVIAGEQNTQLLKRYYVKVAKANYNIALSTGNKHDTAHLKEDYYILKEDNFLHFAGSKKEIKRIWPDYSNVLVKFVKEKKLKFKEDADFVKFFDYLVHLGLI